MRLQRTLLALPLVVLACGGKGSGGATGGDGGGSSSGGGSGGGSGGVGDGGGGGGTIQFHGHANRDGLYVDPAMTTTAAAGVHRDAAFTGAVTGNVYASPLFVADGPGGKAAVYVATESDNVYALDATTGAVLWQKAIGTAAQSTGAGCGNIGPIGITGTPAIDLATRLIVFSAATADSKKNIATHTLHALSIDDGSEKWSVDVTSLKDPGGLAFNPQPQNQRSAVLIVGGVAYVAFGGHYGDCGSYHGWVIGVPLSGTGARAWATQVKGAGIWGPGGPASDGQSIYVTTGNGFGGSATWQESEGVFRLDPGPSFTQQSADYFAPSNWQDLDNGDVDMSGSGPLVIDAPSMTPSALVLAQGKDGNLYLLDRANLGGVGTASVGTLNVLSGEITNSGAWATVGGTTYVVVRPNQGGSGIGCPGGMSGDLVGVKLDPAAPQKMSVAWCVDGKGEGSPIIVQSSAQAATALVWTAGAESSNQLHAWDLATGTLVFKGGAAADQFANVRRFTTPTVGNGRIYVAGDGKLYAYTP